MLFLLACVEIRVESGSADGFGDVARLIVRSEAGDVLVQSGEAEVEWEAESAGELPTVDVQQQGDQLVVDVSCDGEFFCRADVVVSLPASAGLELQTAEGDLRVADAIAGDVWARTDMGDIAISGATGTVDLDSGAGDVNAIGLSSAVARGASGMGDVLLSWTGGVVTNASVESGMGDVSMTVPSGVYDVDASSDLGEVSVDVQTGQGTGAVLSAHTGAGDVCVQTLD